MSAPDLVDAVVGYRAWRLEEDGALVPWTLGAAGAWAPGTNTAACHYARWTGRPAGRPHAPPGPQCMCGLYALHDPSDERLALHPGQAVGAIAAWGEIEVHATGFRAERACVVALARPDRADDETAEALERAADRYGVDLVPPGALSAAASRHGLPVGPHLLGGAAVRRPARRLRDAAGIAVDAARSGACGYALLEHGWAQADDPRDVRVGITRPLGALLGDASSPSLPRPGVAVAPGDPLAVLGDGWVVWATVGGTVTAVNPRLEEEPGLLASDPQGAGWLARIAPADLDRDAPELVWGARGRRAYAAWVARARSGHDVFADVRAARVLAAPPRPWSEVRAELEARRVAPRYASAPELYADCAERVAERLAADPAAAERLGAAGVVLALRVTAPDAAVTVVARDGATRLATGPSAPPADVELALDGDTAGALFAGRLDLPAALRSGRVRSSAGTVPTLAAASRLKALFARV